MQHIGNCAKVVFLCLLLNTGVLRIHLKNILSFRIKIIALVILFFLATHGIAQISEGFYNALPQKLKPANRLNITSAEKRQILSTIDATSVLPYKSEINGLIASLVTEAAQSKNIQVEIDNYTSVALHYEDISHDSSILYFTKVLKAANGMPAYSKDITATYLSISTVYIYEQKFDSAVNTLYPCLNLAMRLKDTTSIIGVYSNYSIIYSRLQNFKSAIYYDRLTMQAYPAKRLWDLDYVRYKLNMAAHYTAFFDESHIPLYKDSAILVTRSVMAQKNLQADYWLQGCYYILGYVEYEDKNYAQAITLFDSSLLPAYSANSRFNVSRPLRPSIFKGICLIRLGKYKEGKQVLDTLELGVRNYSLKQAVYLALSDASVALGNTAMALQYYKQYKAYSDTLNIERQRSNVFESEQKYLAAQREEAITRLENDNLKKEKEKQRVISIALSTAAGLVIVLVVFYVVYKKQQLQRVGERQTLTEELHKMEEDMKLQQEKNVDFTNKAIQEQRKNISRNLHDEVSPDLAALAFFIGDLKQKARDSYEKDLLHEIELETRNVYQNVRRFMHNLFNNSVITQYNVPEFLHNLSRRFSGESSMRITTVFDESDINKNFTAEQHTELYCIIREAVANSMKYSGASALNIALKVNVRDVQFEIHDNGKGLANAGETKGLGLESLKQRAEALNGHLQFSSSNKGTNITGYFPLQ